MKNIKEIDVPNEVLTNLTDFQEQFTEFGVRTQNEDLDLEYYKKILANNEKLKIHFSSCNGSILIAFNGNIELRYSVNSQFFGKISRELSAEMLNREYTLQIKSIDEDRNVVVLTETDEMQKRRKDAIQMLSDKLAAKEDIYIRGQIVGLQHDAGKEHNGQAAYVNIGGLGIMGLIPIKKWSTGYIEAGDFARTITGNVGAIVNFKVTGYLKLDNGFYAYMCSREKYLEKVGGGPWNLVKARLKPKTNVIVRLVSRGKTEGSMFGAIEGINDLNMLCYKDDRSDLRFSDLKIGQYYTGYVSKINPEEKYIRIRLTGKAADRT